MNKKDKEKDKINKKEKNKRSKENKKKLKEIEKQYNEDSYGFDRLMKIFIGVVGALLIFYLIFAFFHGELFHKSNKEKETIQNIEILAGSTFTKQDGEYYVLFYDFNGDNSKLCDGIYNVYNNSGKELKMYKVNLGSGLNKNYIATSAEMVNTESAENLKVLDATLIKVTNGTASLVVSGKDKLVDYEDTLLK